MGNTSPSSEGRTLEPGFPWTLLGLRVAEYGCGSSHLIQGIIFDPDSHEPNKVCFQDAAGSPGVPWFTRVCTCGGGGGFPKVLKVENIYAHGHPWRIFFSFSLWRAIVIPFVQGYKKYGIDKKHLTVSGGCLAVSLLHLAPGGYSEGVSILAKNIECLVPKNYN